MITQNSEKSLVLALESLAPHVDQIVAVDACSTDGTTSILRRFGATVIDRSWPGSFAAQQQVWLDYVRSRQSADEDIWTLFLDDDEVLQGLPAHNVLNVALDAGQDHVYIPRRWLVRTGAGGYSFVSSYPHSPDWQLRMFRVRDGVDWVGKIHPSPRGLTAGGFDPRLAVWHLNLLVVTPAERVAKVRKYERYERWSGYPRYYLIERYPCTLTPLEVSPSELAAIGAVASSDAQIVRARPFRYRLLRPYVALEEWVLRQLRLARRVWRKASRLVRSHVLGRSAG